MPLRIMLGWAVLLACSTAFASDLSEVAESAGIVTQRVGDPLLDQLIQRNNPLTAEQQLKLRDYMINDQRSLEHRVPAANTIGDPLHVIDMTQSGASHEVPLQLGFVSNIMVVGENGAPWVIRRVTSGDGSVVVPAIVEGNSTTIELTPKKPWVTTNLHIYLEGKNETVKLYARVSADPRDGLKDMIRVVVDGVPPGSAPLLQPNRVAVDSRLMNALGQAPGRNWAEVRVANGGTLPFRITYWMAPNGNSAIVRLRGAQMVGPDWVAETRDTDGSTRVYRYGKPVPLMLRVRDTSGLEHQVRLDNAADLLAGRSQSRTMTVKQTSPARPPLDVPLEFEGNIGLPGPDRIQTVSRRPSQGAVEIPYASFDGKGQRTNRVQILTDRDAGVDIAKRLIESSYAKRLTPPVVEVEPLIPGTTRDGEGDYDMYVTSGGIYQNLFNYTQKQGWKAPIWDLGEQDIEIRGSAVIRGDSPEDVIKQFLEPYSAKARFSAEISRTEKLVWIY